MPTAGRTPAGRPDGAGTRRTRLLTALGAASSLLLAACGGTMVDPLAQPAGSGVTGARASVVVGAAPATGSTIVAELYAQALTARGVPATIEPDLGSREAYLAALAEGTVSLVPEHTGSLLLTYDPDSPATTSEEVREALPAALPAGLALGKPSAAVDQAVYVVTRRYARAHDLTSLADLADLPPGAVLGGPSGLPDRAYGPQGLRQVYGARLAAFEPDDSAAVRARDLDAGRIEVAAFSSTEAVTAGRGYVVLADPQAMIRPQNVVPLMRSEVAADPAAVRAVDAVQAALTTAELRALNRAVADGEADPGVVAAEWLGRHGLA